MENMDVLGRVIRASARYGPRVLVGFITLTMMGALQGCGDKPELTTQPPTATCSYYECRGCIRAKELDFACSGHEFLQSAYKCLIELDLCKPNLYGSMCCFPDGT